MKSINVECVVFWQLAFTVNFLAEGFKSAKS